MNRETEERFVRTFIIRQQRERLLLELGSPTRSQNGINRFCHDATALVIPQTLACRGKLKREEIKLFLLPHAERGMCYAISSNEAVDGHFLSLSQALDSVLCFGFPSILVCAHAALVECEQEQGPAEKLILVERYKK